MKKLLSVLLLLTMVFSLCAAPAVAEGEPIELTFYYPVGVGGDLALLIENLAAEFTKENPDIVVHPVFCGNSTETTTKTVGENERIETERNISYNQYMSMMAMADPTRQSIHKIRKSFIWEGQYYELDQFIDPDPGFSVLEMDSEQGEEPKFPPFIKVIKDVTGNAKYYNINLAVKTLYD